MRYYQYPLLPALLLLTASTQAQGEPQSSEARPGCDEDLQFPMLGAVPTDREAFLADAARVFAAADRDHDGVLTLTELHAMSRACREVDVATRFARIDNDGDGAISSEEFAASESHANPRQPPLTSVLLNGTGAVAEHSPAAEVWRREGRLARQWYMAEPVKVTIVAAADVDRDGVLSLNEFLAHQGARFDAANRDRNGEVLTDEWRGPVQSRGVADHCWALGEDGPPIFIRVRKGP